MLTCRIYVGLPDAENRMKILRVLLSQENLEPGFRFNELAIATEGYSGSDLKASYLILLHLCGTMIAFLTLFKCRICALQLLIGRLKNF